MSNSIGTLTPTLVAQSGLALLAATFPVIASIATDFSFNQIPFGTSLIAKIPSVGSVQDYDSVNGYVPTGVNSSDVVVSLNRHKHASFSFNDQELTQISPLLLSQYANSFAVALGNQVMSDISALFVTGNYTYAPTVQALTGVSRSTIVTAETALNSRNVPKSDRFAVLNSAMYGQLLQDPTLINLQFAGVGVTSATLPKIGNTILTEYSALPSTANLQGVIGARDAIAFVSRVPSSENLVGLPQVGNISTVTDPVSQLSVQVRDFYDFNRGQRRTSYVLMYGVAVANPKSLQLIVTA